MPKFGRRKSRRDRNQARPTLEGLEDRKLLYATLGGSFAFGSRITYSFAPDGTNIGGKSSVLFQSMASRGFSTSQWQTAFQKAAAAWAVSSNINLVLVQDNGSAFGATGNQQGDTRFGDIRIGGTGLSSSVLASCFLPPPFNGGTLAGDVVMNTNQAWQINNDYDLQTVATHEIGHALGLDHSTLSTAEMYSSYNGIKQSLTSDDIAGIQAVYGTRQADAYDAAASNNTSSTATNLSGLLNTNAQAAVPALDITSSTDADWYRVTAPANASGTFTVTMQSTNLSSLSPKLLVYNGSLVGIASASIANVYGGTVSVSISGAAGQSFYVKCMAANGGSTGVGSYGLLLNFGTEPMSPIAPPNTVVTSQPDQGGGSSSESSGSELPISVGSITAMGDDLEINPYFARAVAYVNHGLVGANEFTSPAEIWTIRLLATIGHAAPNTEAGRAIRTAMIQAIDSLLEDWAD